MEEGMQFSFEVDPNLDMAIGLETDAVDAEGHVDGADLFSERGPFCPTDAKPGSEDKVRMLSARYAAGLPLWHDADCYDHGPGDLEGFGEPTIDLVDEID
jgi:hypothetical protein